MKNLSQAFDFQRFQQNPKLDAIIRDVESRYGNESLSDEDLSQVNAAGDTTVPTADPEVLLGRHSFPDDMKERRP